MGIVFETERLNIRPFTLQDTAFIIELVNSEGWLKYIGDRNIKTTTDAEAYLSNGPIKSYSQHNFGLWMVELKNSQTPIGMCGLIKRDTLANPDIGFAFLPAFEKQGYAFEAAQATMQYATHVLKLATVLAITLPENNSSIKLLNKIGLQFVAPITMPGDDEKLMLFSNKV